MIELSQAEIAEWTPKTQAIGKLMDAHFEVFNAMESAKSKRVRGRLLMALGTIERAARSLREVK